MNRIALLLLFSCLSLRAEKIVLVMGGGDETNAPDPKQLKLNGPFGVDFDRRDNMFVVDMNGNCVRRWEVGNKVAIIAGTGEKGFSGDGGPAVEAKFNGPHSLAVAANGDVFLADTWNNRVRLLDSRSGNVSTVVGTGTKGYGGDGGPADKAEFGGIYCVAFDPQLQNLYLADLDNRRIRKLNMKTRIVETVAGNGKKGAPEDGALAVNAPLVDPRAVAVDTTGTIYILERGGNALRFVDRDGKIWTLIGDRARAFSPEGGRPADVSLKGPKHLCIDRQGGVLIADSDNHVIRRFIPRGRQIVRVAGTGKKGDKGVGGAPLEAELNQPHGVAVDSKGTIYIADSSNNRVLKIEK